MLFLLRVARTGSARTNGPVPECRNGKDAPNPARRRSGLEARAVPQPFATTAPPEEEKTRIHSAGLGAGFVLSFARGVIRAKRGFGGFESFLQGLSGTIFSLACLPRENALIVPLRLASCKFSTVYRKERNTMPLPKPRPFKICIVKGCTRKSVSYNGTAMNGKRCNACNVRDRKERYRTDPVYRKEAKARSREFAKRQVLRDQASAALKQKGCL